MADYSGYQIALIAILVINLIFWSLVVCFRLFFDCTCSIPFGGTERNETTVRRNRRQMPRRLPSHRNHNNNQLMGLSNPAFSNSEEFRNSVLFNIAETIDPPPSYEDAVGQYRILDSMRDSSHNYRNSITRQSHIRELPIILSVPEETTTSSEIRFQRTLQPNQPEIPSHMPHIYSSNNNDHHSNFTDSISTYDNNAESSAIMIEDTNIPLTFVMDSIGKQSTRILKKENIIVTLTDGKELIKDSNA